MKRIIGVACIASNRAIGIGDKLIFNIKEDMKHFKKTTTNSAKNKYNAVVMGRKTFESIGKPLPGRLNCVLSRRSIQNINQSVDFNDSLKNELYFSDVNSCLSSLNRDDNIDKIYVIGGETIYKHFMDMGLYDELCLSYVSYPINNLGSSFFPYIDFTKYSGLSIAYNETLVEKGKFYNYSIYHLRKNYNNLYLNMSEHKSFISTMSENSDEYQYLNLISKVMTQGKLRKTRNANTISLFSEKMDFDISKSFPLLTTKKVYFKGVVKELLWFLNGRTNSKELEVDKVNIWKGNSSREFLDSIGLEDNNEGDCGPIYGFQWRHFNAEYKGCDYDYKGKGIDQLSNIIEQIKNNPNSRRMFMTAWNPCQLSEMALPPCHVSYQFYVRDDGNNKFLDCMMYQRSGDLFLGVPFNIASTSLLVYILANMCEISPGKISIVIGDAHIYEDHLNQVKTQINRTPTEFPKLKIAKKLDTIEDLSFEDIILEDYNPQSTIKAAMIA